MFRFFSDPALTTPLDRLSVCGLFIDSETQPAVSVVYFGAVEQGILRAVDGGDIVIFIEASGDLLASDVRLASTDAELEFAVGGAGLSLGSTVEGGVGGARPVWIAVGGAMLSGSYSMMLAVPGVVHE